MSLKLMYITKDPKVAQIAEAAGVDQIFVDMEYIGKKKRQGGMDTVQLHHTPEDVRTIKSAISRAGLLVRINPIHEATAEYTSSIDEIEAVLEAGADSIMLPYFKTVQEVETFVDIVAGRAETVLLLETPEAATVLDELLSLDGIDRIHIGLNDMSLGLGRTFMFELLSDGTVGRLAEKIRAKGIPFGIGGIASLGKGMLPAEFIVAEHYRLGSEAAILARSFCNTSVITDEEVIRQIFEEGLRGLRAYEEQCADGGINLLKNKKKLDDIIRSIVENKKQ